MHILGRPKLDPPWTTLRADKLHPIQLSVVYSLPSAVPEKLLPPHAISELPPTAAASSLIIYNLSVALAPTAHAGLLEVSLGDKASYNFGSDGPMGVYKGSIRFHGGSTKGQKVPVCVGAASQV